MTSQISIVVVLLAVLSGTMSAQAAAPSGHRMALLLGNSNYRDAELGGVGKSLDEVETALTAKGFRIARHENLDEKELETAVDDFVRAVPTAGVALVYYHGFGAHVERFGKYYNLLRPVGADINNDGDYRSDGLNVSEMLDKLRDDGGSRVQLVFLDACWASPIKPDGDKVLGGLRAFDVGDDATVMFAADSGETLPLAKDSDPSLLAAALARHCEKLDDSIKSACDAIARDCGNAWIGGAAEAGIGEPSPFPRADRPDEGSTPGESYVNSIGMTFRWCPPGSFKMGSEETGLDATADRQPVQVTLTNGFWMGEHEVTQREYKVIRGRDTSPDFTRHKNAPFWGASEAKSVTEFCKALTEIERKAGTLPSGWEYGCPTEAEWEYACRAGSSGRYCFGDSVAELGNYGNVADRALHSENPNYYFAEQSTDDGVGEALAVVGSYRPNAWGIRDMHGNVAEVVADHLLPQLPGGKDPLGRAEKNGRMQFRGGAWCSVPLYCESSFRNGMAPGNKLDFIGFRIVLKKTK